MLDVNVAISELKKQIPIGGNITHIGYYPTHLLPAFRKAGFVISNINNGVCYQANIQRIY